MFGNMCCLKKFTLVVLILSVLAIRCLSATTSRTDSIALNESISDGQTLVSVSKKFVLGFFSPGTSSQRYVGIWYNSVPRGTAVWVANRTSSVQDTSGILKFDNSGNLIVLDGRGNSFMVASRVGVEDVEAALLDSGNFVLRSITNRPKIIWQSFDSPTDTWLPGMNITVDRLLTSWKSYDNPVMGDYSFSLERGVVNASRFIIRWNGIRFWTSAYWDGDMNSLIPDLTSIAIIPVLFQCDNLACSYTPNPVDRMTKIVLDQSGSLNITQFDLEANSWTLLWRQPASCDVSKVGYEGSGARILHLRVAASELKSNSNSGHKIVWIAPVLSSVAFLIFCLVSFAWIRRWNNKGKGKRDGHPLVMTSDAMKLWESEETGSHIMMLSFSQIEIVTDNFSTENKLGEGGFGPVYKGYLPSGQEIAVKRLAANSRQGLPEFENEILLIAKLQHRNLVGLLGCCIEGEEMILIYEYMPNKSLDFFLFEQSRTLLGWEIRVNIIEGIAQGLIYLHKHSRLRIIHRDLKPSNILLDIDMNPKISDFGMARIFDPKGTLANTKRVVGTYGYMAPEYAMAGIFSVKSDVFSYGVLLLEIISGLRNAGSHRRGNSVNLLGYAWELWKEGRWYELIDKALHGACPEHMVLRCIHVSLLCVQEKADDRPSMTEVISMITNENTTLPDPKEPGFYSMLLPTENDAPEGTCSLNDLSITGLDGR